MRVALGICIVIVIIGLTGCAGGDETAPAAVEIPGKGAPTEAVGTPTPLPSITEAPRFGLYSQDPVFETGSGWDRMFSFPSLVFAQDGLLHMFYYGSKGQDGDALETLGYAISLDGIEWHRFFDHPVHIEGGMAADLEFIRVSSVIRGGNGLWAMYFTSSWTDSGEMSPSFIARATSEKLEGPWVVDDQPVLLPGNPARWDGGGVYDAQVFHTEQGYRMYFCGADADLRQFGPAQIGLAVSQDGIAWTKYDDPETIGRLYEDSDPVFKTGEEGAWDATLAENPQIMRTEDGWVMLYRGTNRERFTPSSGVGFAASSDGIVWERDPINPILDLDAVLDDHTVLRVNWLFYDGRHFLYLTGFQRSFEVIEVFLALGE